MKIDTSLDWQNVHTILRTQMRNVGYNPDLQRMLNNITNMVTELSKVEVDARRKRIQSTVDEKIDKINQAIDHLEKILVIANLMK
jgi:hypothetical protein